MEKQLNQVHKVLIEILDNNKGIVKLVYDDGRSLNICEYEDGKVNKILDSANSDLSFEKVDEILSIGALIYIRSLSKLFKS